MIYFYIYIYTCIYIFRFLREALSTHDSKAMLRKANFLSNRSIHGGVGWALEDLFLSRGRGTELDGLTGQNVPSLDAPKKKKMGLKLKKGPGEKGAGGYVKGSDKREVDRDRERDWERERGSTREREDEYEVM
jgi:hypothetical protein